MSASTQKKNSQRDWKVQDALSPPRFSPQEAGWCGLTTVKDLMAFDEICKIIPYNPARLNSTDKPRTGDTIWPEVQGGTVHILWEPCVKSLLACLWTCCPFLNYYNWYILFLTHCLVSSRVWWEHIGPDSAESRHGIVFVFLDWKQ